jgi:hypothetical protein
MALERTAVRPDAYHGSPVHDKSGITADHGIGIARARRTKPFLHQDKTCPALGQTVHPVNALMKSATCRSSAVANSQPTCISAI